jgi:hypothetical protein
MLTNLGIEDILGCEDWMCIPIRRSLGEKKNFV